MKKIRLSLVLALVWIIIVAPVWAHGGAAAGSAAEPTAEELLKELNGGIGVYKTYDDFVNGKAEKLTFVEWNYFAMSGNVEYVKATVKDENGVKSMLLADEVWGIRTAEGLYRGLALMATGRYSTGCSIW